MGSVTRLLCSVLLMVGTVSAMSPDAAAAPTALAAPTAFAAPTASAAAAAAPLSSVEVTGHGQGHGRGMSQYGAYGYALRGATYDKILRWYYGGTKLVSTPRASGRSAITVWLTALNSHNLKVMVSSAPFTVAGAIHFPAGRAATLIARSDGNIDVYRSVGCRGKEARIATIRGSQGTIVPDVSPGNDVSRMLTICSRTVTTSYRGRLTFIPRSSLLRPTSIEQRTVNTVALDDYLRGVVPRESIASWGNGRGMEALKVQAVAARTYALAEHRARYAKTCDTTACQVYGGAGRNGARIEDSRTDHAVAVTSGQVMLTASGAFAYTEFGASSGGWTAGGQFPAVQDLGDATPTNPYHNWTLTKDLRVLGPRYGVGTLTSAVVTSRDGRGTDGGRVLAVKLTGSSGTRTVTGDDVRRALGLYSNWFVLHTG